MRAVGNLALYSTNPIVFRLLISARVESQERLALGRLYGAKFCGVSRTLHENPDL